MRPGQNRCKVHCQLSPLQSDLDEWRGDDAQKACAELGNGQRHKLQPGPPQVQQSQYKVEAEFLAETPLSASFAEDLQDCSGVANFFDRTAGGIGPYAYDWDFDDGFHSTEKNPTHTYDRPGNYTVRLLARDRSGKEASASRPLVVGICLCTISGQDHACLGKTETYKAAMPGSIPGSIQWRLDGKEIDEGVSWEDSFEDSSIDIDWQDFGLGLHDLQVYVTDAKAENGPKQLAACNMTITVLPVPVATINMVV